MFKSSEAKDSIEDKKRLRGELQVHVDRVYEAVKDIVAFLHENPTTVNTFALAASALDCETYDLDMLRSEWHTIQTQLKAQKPTTFELWKGSAIFARKVTDNRGGNDTRIHFEDGSTMIMDPIGQPANPTIRYTVRVEGKDEFTFQNFDLACQWLWENEVCEKYNEAR